MGLPVADDYHQGAIDMAKLALERATHAKLRNLARDVIVTQAEGRAARPPGPATVIPPKEVEVIAP